MKTDEYHRSLDRLLVAFSMRILGSLVQRVVFFFRSGGMIGWMLVVGFVAFVVGAVSVVVAVVETVRGLH